MSSRLLLALPAFLVRVIYAWRATETFSSAIFFFPPGCFLISSGLMVRGDVFPIHPFPRRGQGCSGLPVAESDIDAVLVSTFPVLTLRNGSVSFPGRPPLPPHKRGKRVISFLFAPSLPRQCRRSPISILLELLPFPLPSPFPLLNNCRRRFIPVFCVILP